MVEKNLTANTVTVSQSRITEGVRDYVSLTGTSYTFGELPEGELMFQYRYHGPLLQVKSMEAKDSELLVRLAETPKEGIPPGQAGVLYKGEECVGGGTIA